jgi:hypothetical protein
MISGFLQMCLGSVLLSFFIMLLAGNIARLIRDGLED